MYICMWLSNRIMIVLFWCLYVYICMYVYRFLKMSLGIIIVEEWFLTQVDAMKRFLVYEESSGKSSHEKYMMSISCGYELILYACIMPLSMLWTCYTKGYINKRKQCGLWHAGTSMDKTLEARFLGRDNLVLDVWY